MCVLDYMAEYICLFVMACVWQSGNLWVSILTAQCLRQVPLLFTTVYFSEVDLQSFSDSPIIAFATE